MNILEEIVIHKRKEVELGKLANPISLLEKSVFFARKTFSITNFLNKPFAPGIIAEFKRQSPSKGIINNKAKVELVTSGYADAGVSALSILTDNQYFGGKNEDLTKGREMNSIPVLRKDFIIDEYQIIEAKAIGADVILLIAAILTPEEIKNFAALAHSLELEVLLEVHDKNELDLSLNPEVDLVGVNNRNLKDFSVSIDTSLELAPFIPDEFIKISESGISDPKLILTLKQAGFRGFLIGENFMQSPDPATACKTFIEDLRKLEKKSTLNKTQ